MQYWSHLANTPADIYNRSFFFQCEKHVKHVHRDVKYLLGQGGRWAFPPVRQDAASSKAPHFQKGFSDVDDPGVVGLGTVDHSTSEPVKLAPESLFLPFKCLLLYVNYFCKCTFYLLRSANSLWIGTDVPFRRQWSPNVLCMDHLVLYHKWQVIWMSDWCDSWAALS